MKNKTKKILAGACLGLVGMGALSGCAMTDNQKAALDLIAEKSDEIVNLIESNMQYNNKNLSKEDAVEKIFIARNKFKFSDFDTFEMSMISNTYDGIFDGLTDSYTPEPEKPYRWLYREDGNKKTLATALGDELCDISVSNFDTDEHLFWEEGDEGFSSREYRSRDFVFDHFDKFLSSFVASAITKDHIKDIVVTENGYEFSIFVSSPNGYNNGETDSKLFVTFDGFVTRWVCKGIMNNDGNYESMYTEFNFKYNDVNFSIVDTKLNSLNNN